MPSKDTSTRFDVKMDKKSVVTQSSKRLAMAADDDLLPAKKTRCKTKSKSKIHFNFGGSSTFGGIEGSGTLGGNSSASSVFIDNNSSTINHFGVGGSSTFGGSSSSSSVFIDSGSSTLGTGSVSIATKKSNTRNNPTAKNSTHTSTTKKGTTNTASDVAYPDILKAVDRAIAMEDEDIKEQINFSPPEVRQNTGITTTPDPGAKYTTWLITIPAYAIEAGKNDHDWIEKVYTEDEY